MATLSLTQIDEATLANLVRLVGPTDDEALWEELARTPLSPERAQELAVVLRWLRGFDTVTINESTLWARAIYPVLVLAEEERVRAWSQVPLRASVVREGTATEIVGVVDGALAREGVAGGQATPPFLLVVEAKRGIDAADPRPQLLAAMLASIEGERAALKRGDATIERFGCFTVGDTWKFLHAKEQPTLEAPGRVMTIGWSRPYSERFEASVILATLRGVVLRGIAEAP